MAFSSFDHLSYSKEGAGINLKPSLGLAHTTTDYVDGTPVGLFGQLLTSTKDSRGKLSPLTGAANPILVLTLRDDTTATENDGLLKNPYHTQMGYIVSGYATIAVDPAVTPKFKDKVYAINTVGATLGLATNVATGNVDAGAYFDTQVDTGVWSIVIK